MLRKNKHRSHFLIIALSFRFADIEIQKPIDRVKIFKQYVLELVNAATPALKRNKDIMENGCKCIPIIERESKSNPFNQLLATLSIARDYYTDLQVIRQTDDIATLKIEAGLMENIRKIVVLLQAPEEDDEVLSTENVLKKYVLEHVDVAGYDKILKSVTACYRSTIGMFYVDNRRFFSRFHDGLDSIRAIVRGDSKDEEHDLTQIDDIMDELYAYELRIPGPDYIRQRIERLLNWLNEDSRINVDTELLARQT